MTSSSPTLPTGWREVRWGELATLEYGKSLKEYESGGGEYRVFGTNGPIGWHTEPLCGFASVVIGRKGAYRGVHYSPAPFFVIDTAFFLKPRVELDTRWAYYRLLLADINGMDSGSAIPSTSRDDFYALPVRVPPLQEQREIAGVLGAFDDKIELNRRMNETLEAMARALFKSWFVDFEPVRAKMEGRWHRGESLPGLPAEYFDLFPDRLVPSQLGDIPEGWEVKPLGEISHKAQYGYTQSAKDEPVGPKFLRITDINKKAWIEWDSVPHCEIGTEDSEKYRLHKGDILIARMADPGHGCLIEEEREAVFASYLIRFRPLREHYARLLQYWLRSDAYWELVEGRGAGTTRVSLNAKVLGQFPLVVPSSPLLEVFERQTDELRTRVVVNTKDSSALAEQRDALLPLLVSGEVRV